MLDLNAASIFATLLPFAGAAFFNVSKSEWKDWYRSLKKPFFQPPEWVFPIVWTSLYASMGYASYMIYRDAYDVEKRNCALSVYAVHLLINWSFTPVFFGRRKLGWGFVICAVLWVFVANVLKLFHDINKDAAIPFVPYLMWCTLATALAFCLWKNNPDAMKEEKKETQEDKKDE